MTAYIKSKTFSKSKHSGGLAILSFLIILAIFGLVFLYVIQTNELVNKSYQIRDQKDQIKKLLVENHNLEMEIAKIQSPANLEELVQLLGMVEVDQIVYLEEKVVAVKE